MSEAEYNKMAYEQRKRAKKQGLGGDPDGAMGDLHGAEVYGELEEEAI